MSITENLTRIRADVESAAQGRDVTLLAVSKTFGVDAIDEAIAAGQRAFGENYVQEGVEKVKYFKAKYPEMDIEWHMIGPLQSNKTRLVAEHFDWVQSVDREKIAKRLSEQRPEGLPDLNILIEVNVDLEDSKSGVEIDEVEELLAKLVTLPRIKVRGLMCIPNPNLPIASTLLAFRKMKALFESLKTEGFDLDVLSMGMSSDFVEAIQEGATVVRVGSAIFGARDYSKKLTK